MKYIAFLLVLISGIINSQTHRFIYEYQYKSDTSKAKYNKANMVLDVNPDDVRFYTYSQIEVDSTNKKHGYKSSFWDDEVPTLLRKPNAQKNTNFYLIEGYFKVESDDPIKWTLSNETKTYAGYNLQKATSNFAGRNWEAWFTKDIAISEGPYKFNGLPGMVFQVNDSKDQFNFKLLKSYKLDQTYDSSSFIEKFGGQNPISLSQARLNKLLIDYYKNPLNDFKESFKNRSPGDVFKVMNIEVKSLDQFKQLTEMTQKRIRDNNNPIELDKKINYPN